MTFKNKKILAIIPARSGSKQIKNKNLIKISNKTLLEYALIFSKECNFFDKIIVSTDSLKYKKISESYKVKVPFLRPKKLSKDKSTDLELVQHCLDYLKLNEKFIPDYIVHLRPTSPLRKIKDVEKGLSILIKKKNFDSLKTISPSEHSIFKTWFKEKNNRIFPVIAKKNKFIEPYNMPRQLLQKSFNQTALFDIYRGKIVTKKKVLSGSKIYGLLTKKYLDIDTREDLKIAKKYTYIFKNFRKFINS